MSKLRLGIVGCGDIAFRSYLPAIQKLADQAELVATCDIDLARAKRAKEEYGAPSAFADAGDMLARAELDGVLVLTSMVPHGPPGCPTGSTVFARASSRSTTLVTAGTFWKCCSLPKSRRAVVRLWSRKQASRNTSRRR